MKGNLKWIYLKQETKAYVTFAKTTNAGCLVLRPAMAILNAVNHLKRIASL